MGFEVSSFVTLPTLCSNCNLLIPISIDARNGQLSQRKAAKCYVIPQATVSDHIRGRVSDGALPGRQPVIPRKFKSEIAQRAMQAASMEMGMSKLQLLHKVEISARSIK
jgi:hypothetical protein